MISVCLLGLNVQAESYEILSTWDHTTNYYPVSIDYNDGAEFEIEHRLVPKFSWYQATGVQANNYVIGPVYPPGNRAVDSFFAKIECESDWYWPGYGTNDNTGQEYTKLSLIYVRHNVFTATKAGGPWTFHSTVYKDGLDYTPFTERGGLAPMLGNAKVCLEVKTTSAVVQDELIWQLWVDWPLDGIPDYPHASTGYNYDGPSAQVEGGGIQSTDGIIWHLRPDQADIVDGPVIEWRIEKRKAHIRRGGIESNEQWDFASYRTAANPNTWTYVESPQSADPGIPHTTFRYGLDELITLTKRQVSFPLTEEVLDEHSFNH
jgi:hypothetical protein